MVRELFVMAREHAPSIIFMDEIDSIGSSRGGGGGGGGDSEVQRTMLELLNQLDGFEATKNIKVIMATNRIDILDPALLRPGRIDRKIEFPPPGCASLRPAPPTTVTDARTSTHRPEARVSILRIHSRKMSLQRGINLRSLAEKMGNCSGAEVRGICTERACTHCASAGSTSRRRTLSSPLPRCCARRARGACRRPSCSTSRRPRPRPFLLPCNDAAMLLVARCDRQSTEKDGLMVATRRRQTAARRTSSQSTQQSQRRPHLPLPASPSSACTPDSW